ncbi:hypothetical protein [Halorubrum sp. Ib24]|uniref:hypothetical protein n=1 Tax=Halorubrum sp. Ib24 TaxID=1383850 RepID=UPI00117B546E|nr:hypothetical protein [Halorubrum sp. Ib24]
MTTSRLDDRSRPENGVDEVDEASSSDFVGRIVLREFGRERVGGHGPVNRTSIPGRRDVIEQ